MYHFLLVEDDRDLSSIAYMTLTHAGHRVDTAFTCAEAQQRLETTTYDLILLDIMLPDYSGDELCRRIRQDCDSPIIFMSCLEDSDTIIGALRSGGDDYMVKPVHYPELLARADAIIRRSKQTKKDPVREYQGFTMDTLHRRVLCEGEDVGVTAIEYALLEYMADHPDKLLLYQELHENVWKNDSMDDFRNLGVHVSNLRKKVDPTRRGIIENVRGAGYIFSDV